MQWRVEQIESNEDQLLLPDNAKRFILSLGIMEDATIVSPNQTEKGKIKNEEGAVSHHRVNYMLNLTISILQKRAHEVIKKLANEKKERERLRRVKLEE